jgi:predicted O-methyltransferase YrrM
MAKKPLVDVEIGTGFGQNAISLLRELSIERLYCIDPFVAYADGEVKIQRNFLLKSEYTLKMLSKFKNVTLIRKTSSEARKEIPKNVDFVYIDGNHGYDYVLADLQNFYPLTAENGIIAGHDLDWPSVHKALDDFCRVNTIKPILLPPDWIIIK